MSEAFARQGGPGTGEGVSRPVLLRAAREAAGLHIAALAAALKVPVRKLEALEAGRYEELPDLTFARALASSACRHLKVDPVPVLEQIPNRVVRELGGSRQNINASFQSAQDPGPINPVSWLSRPALLAAIVLLLGALVIVFLPRVENAGSAQDGTAGTATVSEPLETEESVGPAEPVPAQEPQAPAAADGQTPATVGAAPAASLVPATPASPAAGVPAATVATSASASAPHALLTIAATGETWIEVVNGARATVVQRVLNAGESIDFSTAPPYSVVLGRADAAQVTVRGKALDVQGQARNNVARFEVK
ncbi:RodZ domain-containing protein [Hydrogenophaga sp. BPS33]|uniref:RodZ domain-containing protein n=1 Tax=Hydrogenophaga sp. BPS33 TaxID=2651974 RepID=UPI00131F7774|nr:RodZ domain-containing protein [Hydrogenophaga sp. BPS33]QHE85818.1 helix-turn-helix domain-containing protein [Hydrogenophaga sp. BPS33]